MKKTIAVITLLASLCANIFADGKPSWYTEEVQVSEMEIRRKNSEGVYADFIDKTFSACAHVRVTDEIQSLEEARSKAEKAASEKLDSYFKAHKENDALKGKHELYGWSYDYSLENGGAYVQVQVVVKKEKPKVASAALSTDSKKNLSENSNIGSRIISYDSERMTLVDKINFASEEALESHKVSLTTKEDENGNKISKYSKTKQAFYYPDGVLIHDTTYNLTDTLFQFNLKNTVKGRKTLIVIRIDALYDNDEIVLSYKGQDYKSKIDKDTKNRWRNIVFEIEEGTISEYNPQFFIRESKSKQVIGSIFVYQLL